MNNAQKAVLKAAILADPALVPLTSGPTTDYNGLVTILNSAGTTQAWRANVSPVEIDEATPWTSFDSISPAGKRDSYLHAFLRFPRDFARQKTRKWLTDVWGNATNGSNAESIFLGCAIEIATRAEEMIGGNVESINAVSALDRSFNGLVSLQDVVEMFNV